MCGSLRFEATLRRRLEARLARFEHRTTVVDGRRAAVVLILVPDSVGEAAVIITQRAANLRHHGGQWALPGGRLEPGESASTAARRELAEEVGLKVEPEDVLGQLDDYPTRSGFVITPFVMWGEGAGELRPDPREVAAAHTVPVATIARPETAQISSWPGSDRPLLSLALLGTLIFAPTAAILHQFAELAVHDREIRVVDFDQPRFAWR